MNSLSLQKIKIPSLLAIIMVAVLMTGIVVGTKQIGQIRNFFSLADQGAPPSGPVEIANITDNSFTIFWTTDEESAGAVHYGKTASLEGGVAIDDRDLTNPSGKYLTHFVRLSGLSENTNYFFKVGISQASHGDPNNNQAPFEAKTGIETTDPPSVEPIFGAVNFSGGSKAEGAIAVWQSDGASKIATLVKSDGSYVLPLAAARTKDLKSHFTFKEGTPEQISLNLSIKGSSLINCTFGADKPLPTVKLGENADCSGETTSVASASARFKVPAKTTPISGSSTNTEEEQLNIVSGQSVSTPFPTISGKVGPRQMVKITINSETPYSGTVIADPNGIWSWTPPAGLTPGQHTVEITIVNSDGSTQTITRNFTVTTGEALLPLSSATPSAETSHLACVNSACTSVVGSGVDSCSTNFDCEASSETPPVSGSEELTILVLIFGAIFLIVSGSFLIP